MTRALKNIRYLEWFSPRIISKKDMHQIEKLSHGILLKLDTISKPKEHIPNTKLAGLLEMIKFPLPKATVSGPLFKGTLVFIRLIFNRPGQPQFSMTNADVQTAINYSTMAIRPIHAYAYQYGRNSIGVSQNIIQFTVNLTGNTFNDNDVQGWVDTFI